MKDFSRYIIEKLRVSKNNFAKINLDTFKRGIDIYDITHLEIKPSRNTAGTYATYYTVNDQSGNDISFIEETYEGTTVYTLIVPDETYEYFCNEFSMEENDENDEHWSICPEELYDILVHNIPDFIRGSKIYITPVSTWLDKRDNFLSETDFDYIKFRDTFREIKNKLSDNGDI